MAVRVTRLSIAGFDERRMGPWVRECDKPQQLEKETDLLIELPERKHSPVNTFLFQ